MPENKTLPAMMTSLKVGDECKVEIVDQLLLPHEVKWFPVETLEEAFDAIKTMKIRGAPAIASLAALTLARQLHLTLAGQGQTFSLESTSAFRDSILPKLDYLQSSRPTAVNLGEAMDRIREAVTAENNDAKALAQSVQKACEAVHSADLKRNRDMGLNGADWLWNLRKEKAGGEGLNVLTVCNTGSLATSGYGTAIGVITSLYETGRLNKAFYTQTTPYHQGSRLTSLELTTLQIPSCMICDTMVGSLFQHQRIDAVIVGADRVVKNGDTANKIGTYQAAVLAQRHGVPFMVVAPCTTLDLAIETGKDIHIEQRPPVEATLARGKDIESGKLAVVRITPEGVGAGQEIWQEVYNPSFDVTPAELISCVVTEKGVAEQSGSAIDLSNVC